MNTFIQKPKEGSREIANAPSCAESGCQAPPQFIEMERDTVVQQRAASGSSSNQANLHLKHALDRSPRVTAQAKLASALSNAPVQRRCGPQKKIEPLTGMSPQAGLEEEAVIQSKSATLTTGAVAQRESANRTGLPDSLKSGVEAMSGLSMDDVRVHYNSDKPAQLQAHAYTQGSDIHVAPGQEQHLAHEAWHVVQQKQGRVAPTAQLKGIALNDDDSLEKEADRMGAQAFQMKAEKPGTPHLSFEQSSSPGSSSVFQMARTRRKEFKNERQRLATEKRMGPIRALEEQAEDEYSSSIQPGDFEEPTHIEEEEAHDPEKAYEDKFDRYLIRGIRLILGEEVGGIGPGVRFGSFTEDTKESPATDKYDVSNWVVEEDTTQSEESEEESDTDSQSGSESDDEPNYKLVMKAGVNPADAVDALFDNLGKWAFDCAEAVQVAQWYAMRHALGKKKFNRKMRNLEFALKSHDSTGLGDQGMYLRTDDEDEYNIDSPLRFRPAGSSDTTAAEISQEEILENAPIGTRVLLSVNDEGSFGTDFENENIVKIGPDLYAGHPLGIGSLDWMIGEVAKTALDIDEEDDITPKVEQDIARMRDKIFISEIEFIRKR